MGISLLGLFSIIVLIPCIYALFMHHKLITKRGSFDDALRKCHELEDELDYEFLSTESEKLEEIKKAQEDLKNAAEIYNDFVCKFPGKIIALIVGLKPEHVEICYDEKSDDEEVKPS